MSDALLKKILRKQLLILFHACIVIASFLLAFSLRFDLTIPGNYLSTVQSLIIPILLIKLMVFWRFGLFSGWWRYVSLPDLLTLIKANVFASLLFIGYVSLAHRFEGFPRSVFLLDVNFCFLLMSGARVATRLFREGVDFNTGFNEEDLKRVVVVGAGALGQTIVREISQCKKLKKTVIGFVDEDEERQGQTFHGVPVLGMPKDLSAVIKNHSVDMVIIAHHAVKSKDIRQIVNTCNHLRVQSKILPAMRDIIDGNISVDHLRDVQLEDLLGRQPVRIDEEQVRDYLRGKRILITGAGGSIGSEICRQVAKFNPELIILLENAETPLFHIEMELNKKNNGINIFPCLGDIRDRATVESVFSEYRPEVVFHAAAYKHVPMSEKNPVEVVKTNIWGTRNIANASDQFNVKRFVMVSTDKAVNPTNVMGATKRAAEILVQNLAGYSHTQFVTVRFGNVLGSNGSVVPTFKEQIRNGGPVTVTDPKITRFFMTIPEAVQLTLQAGSMGKGGEIFLLDMGESVPILQLAEEMIRLSGLKPYEDIDIVFTGLRPGEKLYEELLIAGENVTTTTHEKICVLKANNYDKAVLDEHLEALSRGISAKDSQAVREALRLIVPEYTLEPLEVKPKNFCHLQIDRSQKGKRIERFPAVNISSGN